MPTPKPAKCHIRLVESADFAALEQFYKQHEDVNIPVGYFEEFCEVIRSDYTIYLVAESDGRLVGGGGICDYQPRVSAQLTFGIVDPRECRNGYGTSLLLARLICVEAGFEGSLVSLEATEWSVDFFSRLGFKWNGHTVDEADNVFFHGYHYVHERDHFVFCRLLKSAGVSFGEEVEPLLNLLKQ